MALFALGINHKTASVEVRERVAFAPETLPTVHQEVCKLPDVDEAVIVSTCNRSEIYYAIDGDQLNDEQHRDEVLRWLSDFHQIPYDELRQSAYLYEDLDAVSHLAKVASGLDSLVLGEPQILGQLKSAYAVAQESQTVGQALNRLFQHSFNVAKQVRTQTAIGENPVSVAYAAVSLSSHIFADLSTCTALLIGAGETIDLVARHLKEKNIKNLIVANRTLARAETLAQQFNAQAIMLGDIPEHLHKADIVISSTASQLPILGKGTVEAALKTRKHAPMFMVDIAVPRDIEAQVGELSDVYLYSVDDLKEVIDENLKNRQAAAAEAQDLVLNFTLKFGEQQRAMVAVDSIKALRQQINSLKESELEKAKRRLANGESPEQVLEQLANGLTNKFAHQPSTFLKKAGAEGRQEVIGLVNELFNLDNS